jgi:phosphoribosylformylglycinamidine cyclo-ligase
MRKAEKRKAYASAGVDIDLGNRVKKGLQEKVRTTFGPEVLGRIGGFGGLFKADFKGLKEPVLVSSIDGVGTKLKVAIALGKHATVAQDLVNHCINDIAVTGARPLFFLDYIGAERLDPLVFNQLISGFTKGCKDFRIFIIPGNTIWQVASSVSWIGHGFWMAAGSYRRTS